MPPDEGGGMEIFMKIIKRAFAGLLSAVLLMGLAGCMRVAVVDGNTEQNLPSQTPQESDDVTAREPENTGSDYIPDDEYESGLDFNEIEMAELSAPYNALVVEYEDSFYYIDVQGCLCRTTTDMTDYELYCYTPFGGSCRIIGVTNAGRMYLSNGAQSCYIDLFGGENGTVGECRAIETQSFTGLSRPLALFGIRGQYMYYTKSDEPGLFRAQIAAQPEGEEKILNTEIRDAAVVGDFLVYTYENGNRMNIEVVDAENTSTLLYSAESTSDEPVLNLVAADNRSGTTMIAYETHDPVGWLIGGGSIYACNLENSYVAEPVVVDAGRLPFLAYCFDGDGEELVSFRNCLRFSVIGKLSGTTSGYYPDAYYTDDDFKSFFAITYAGNDWYFFTDADQGGAQYAIKEAGDDIIRLQ